jgi:hypothetical protein
MRRSYRDWIAWTVVAAIMVIVGTEYYVQQQTGMSTPSYVYKIVVTGERPSQD